MERSSIIRINSIKIQNVKNVSFGEVNLNKVDDETRGSSVVGLYGQNGSGKTALIWALDLVKVALSGMKIPSSAAYYIKSGEEKATVNVEFLVNIGGREYNVLYELVIKKNGKENIIIESESLDYSAKATDSFDKINRSSILNIKVDNEEYSLDSCLYGPEIRIKEFANKDKSIRQKLIVIQALAKSNSNSYIFNNALIDMFKEALKDDIYFKIIESLMFFSRFNFFVLNKNCDMSYNMNVLPLTIRLDKGNNLIKSDGVPIGLSTNTIDKDRYDLIEKTIDQIDILMGKIIPGLNVELVQLDTQLDSNGNPNIVFELVSNRNGIKTPLRYESEGIKKILGILSSLIAMYNDKSIFVAIDELDASIFEYLLGEILLVIKNTGKGQLLFTSHNMRPLEVLDNSNIYFTTTNPNNKYIQFVGVKNNNNLRNLFLRAIDLGGQKEDIYENTDQYQIGKAFRKAGDFINGFE